MYVAAILDFRELIDETKGSAKGSTYYMYVLFITSKLFVNFKGQGVRFSKHPKTFWALKQFLKSNLFQFAFSKPVQSFSST